MTRARSMRTLPLRLCNRRHGTPLAARIHGPPTCLPDRRCFAVVKPPAGTSGDAWFTSGAPLALSELSSGHDHRPPDRRVLQLGKSMREVDVLDVYTLTDDQRAAVRVLHERLPTLLQTPLPSEVLSPRITLHLFPSTHPHLPAVSGRIGYVAALWTAPVVWGRVPLVGNVKLAILSERMVRGRSDAAPASSSRKERLVVKWKTCGKVDADAGLKPSQTGGDTNVRSTQFADRRAHGEARESASEDFCGIFIFEFDDEGRIVKHVIENTEHSGNWDRTTRVVSVTDWLLGKFNARAKEEVPALACCPSPSQLSQRPTYRR